MNVPATWTSIALFNIDEKKVCIVVLYSKLCSVYLDQRVSYKIRASSINNYSSSCSHIPPSSKMVIKVCTFV
jgi:hypothetical protein